MARLKIATFNINGIRARQDALLEWLEREQPDIACLQELKAPDEAFPQAELERIGYGALWHGQKSWNGVAILARGSKPEEQRRGLPNDPDESQSRYLEADVQGLRVACLYLPNGNPWPGPKFDYKLAWFARLRTHASKLLKDDVPTILCGDFNVVPTDELDIYNPASWRKDALLQPESREAWFALLGQGWTDAIRAVHGDARIYTFWDYFRKHWDRDAGLRIDHLLLSPSLAPLLRDAGVDRWVRGQPGASDHAPTWVELDTTAKATRVGRARAESSARSATSIARASVAKGRGAGKTASAGAEGAATRKAGAASVTKTVARPAKTASARTRSATVAPAPTGANAPKGGTKLATKAVKVRKALKATKATKATKPTKGAKA
ncbi:exodeoxyribonuclease III [Cognatilysobacter lacus]|uniref:Exodeoxyribonuclease III n=1 Tax=Cognatilysobacter lacus TaxID=1643323 RepID=A0A5D8Z998_9GAMM|nr:exodeoxyribonuclease III [Lysobacter lacus]TZF91146.1 exodeoxyribonuclease III [Lysobacter lacus]